MNKKCVLAVLLAVASLGNVAFAIKPVSQPTTVVPQPSTNVLERGGIIQWFNERERTVVIDDVKYQLAPRFDTFSARGQVISPSAATIVGNRIKFKSVKPSYSSIKMESITEITVFAPPEVRRPRQHRKPVAESPAYSGFKNP
jgi:hypothetical protein